MKNVLVCGGRSYSDARAVNIALSVIHQIDRIGLIVHGGAEGADRLADNWAAAKNVSIRRFPADWDRFGKGAGPKRNQQMLDEQHIDLVVAFPGGKGTEDMIRRAMKEGVPVVLVPV